MENDQDKTKSLKPPLQPLDIKKPGIPPPLLLIIVVAGFALAAAIFAFLSKAATKNALAQKQKQAPISKPKAVSVPPMEVVPAQPPPGPVSQEPVEAKPVPTLTLSGILFSEKGSAALINGKIVSEGGSVEGAKLEKISSDKVELSFEGQKIILRSR